MSRLEKDIHTILSILSSLFSVKWSFMNEKKRLDLLKIERFLATYPCVLYFQYQSMSLAQWNILKKRVQESGDVRVLLVKNTLVEHHVQIQGIQSRTLPFFAGPSFFVGCVEPSQIQLVVDAFRGYKNILCIGGFYNNSILTHLDVAALMSLDTSVYPGLITSFGAADRLYTTLHSGHHMHIVGTPSGLLIQCLRALALHKAGVESST
jgi:ribosomal protein L10